jgi:nicotinate-nucleotide adenylyltransferase
MRTGIFGGSFNPPHRGHAEALRAFISAARLDKTYVIPTFIPPHKDTPVGWAKFEDRLEMCRLAFSDINGGEGLIFSDIEKIIHEETGDKSFTWRTLERLSESCKDDFCLYVGTDMFLTLESWKNPEYLSSRAEIWVMPRGESSDGEIPSYKKYLEDKFKGCNIHIIECSALDASSTKIRSGNLGLLDSRVREFIAERELYK